MAKVSDKDSIVWDGTNEQEVAAFAGKDPLNNPAANFARVWNGETGGFKPTLTVYNDQAHTTYPVEVGDTLVKDDRGLRPVTDRDLSGYELRHKASEDAAAAHNPGV